MKRRIYTDTSVIGGCLDKEFRVPSERLIETFVRGDATAVISELTRIELQGAPARVRDVLARIPQIHKQDVALTKDAALLAEQYILEKAVGLGMIVDAQHIAIATVERVDVLVSWNFKHIVNLQRIHAYNAVNLRLGYPMIEIRSPQEVVDHEEGD